MQTLFYAPHTCSLATHIVLEDVGADYALRRVDCSNDEQKSPEFLAINPKARVPALITEKGILTETPAMLVYLAQTHPEAGLAPMDDPFAFAELQAFNSYLGSTVHVAHAHRMRGHRWANEETSFEDMRRKVPESVSAGFQLIEEGLLKGPWVMGERYSIADPYLFTLAQWMEADGVDVARFPRVIDHRTRMSERPNVAKAVAEELAA